MSYRLKGAVVTLEGDINKLVARALPITPIDGEFILDSADKKLKVWNATLARWIILGDASDTKFDNSSNSFEATTVQTAIEEAKNSSISKSRFTIVTCFNGTVGNNQWLGFSEVLPGNQVPIRIAVKCNLREISLSYTQSNILGIPLSSEQIDGQFKVFKNGLTDPTNVVNTTTLTNEAGGKIITGLNIPLDSGDFIVSKWIDTGNNPSDMAVVYYFEVIQ